MIYETQSCEACANNAGVDMLGFESDMANSPVLHSNGKTRSRRHFDRQPDNAVALNNRFRPRFGIFRLLGFP
jgi:hypothetical protein